MMSTVNSECLSVSQDISAMRLLYSEEEDMLCPAVKLVKIQIYVYSYILEFSPG